MKFQILSEYDSATTDEMILMMNGISRGDRIWFDKVVDGEVVACIRTVIGLYRFGTPDNDGDFFFQCSDCKVLVQDAHRIEQEFAS